MGMSEIIGASELRKYRTYRQMFAEFFGMCMFMICVSSVAVGWGHGPDLVEVGIGIGLAIASHAQAFGHVSGGHLNPAVTLGVVVSGRMPICRGVLYIIAQMIGAIVGSALVYSFTPGAERDASRLGCNFINPKITVGQGFGIELLFTFMLVFFVLSITDPKKKQEPYGTTLGIGVMILVAHVCMIPYTNCSINPARSFGPAVIMDFWTDHWVFWIAPLAGGLIAGLLYPLVFFVEEEEAEESVKVTSVKNGVNNGAIALDDVQVS